MIACACDVCLFLRLSDLSLIIYSSTYHWLKHTFPSIKSKEESFVMQFIRDTGMLMVNSHWCWSNMPYCLNGRLSSFLYSGTFRNDAVSTFTNPSTLGNVCSWIKIRDTLYWVYSVLNKHKLCLKFVKMGLRAFASQCRKCDKTNRRVTICWVLCILDWNLCI